MPLLFLLHLSLAIAAKNSENLVANHFLDGGSCRLEVLARIEIRGMLRKMLADCSSHSQAKVRIDIDFADGHAGSFAQHIFRNAQGAIHLAAIFIDLLYKLRDDRACAMQNDGEAGEQLADFLENIETQLGLCARLELVGAVACANGDSKGIHARFSNELVDFFGASIGGIFLLDFQLILNTCKPAQLAFYNDAAIVRIFDYFFGERDVLLKRKAYWRKLLLVSSVRLR